MREILVYADKGVDGASLKQTVKSLEQEADLSRHPLKRLDAAALVAGGWEDQAALLVVPGGRDIFYHDSLSGEGTDRVRRFVSRGGGYLGICAGAYFASSAIEFEKGGPFEVCGKRSLEFYPGTAVGPALGRNKYLPESTRGAAATLITWKNAECHAYYNGGCLFAEAERFSNVEVLAHYADLKELPPAVVSCEVGKGRAILSGVHLEYNPRHISGGDPHVDPMLPILEKGEELRRVFFRSLLLKLGIELKKNDNCA